jgi:glycosyltransferase involved in cell wall biosynthesis
MNIAVIGVGILPTVSSNGIPAFHAALRELAKLHSVTVYSFIPVLKSEADIRVRCVYPKKLPQKLQFILLGILFLWDHLFRRFDIIHAQSPFPAGILAHNLSRFLGVPWLLSFHAGEAAEMPEVPYGDLLNPFLRRVNTRVTMLSRFIMTMSEHQAAMVRKNFAIDRELITLPRGIRSNPLKEKTFNLPWKFIHISYNQPVKGVEMLLETIRHVEEFIPCELTIVGGNYGHEFRSQLAKYKLKGAVHIAGPVSNDQAISMMLESDFLIHTSWCEGLPMVALEAMSHGVVVCGTAVGVMSDLSPSCCITVLERDAVALGNKIVQACRDKEIYLSTRMNAWNWISDHDMDWYVKELTNHYKKIIAKW